MRRAVLALLVLPLALAACGGSKAKNANSGPPLDVVRTAAQKTAKAGSAHLALTANVVTGGQNVDLQGTGAFDTASHQGMLHATFSASALSGTIDEVLNGTDLYLKSDIFSVGLPAGKTWIKIDLAKAAKSRGVNLQTLLAQDPSQAMQALQSISGAVKLGTATIAGVSTTHYRAQLDPAKLPAALRNVRGYEVWVGNDGYVRRVKAVASAGTSVTATVTTDLSSFGSKVGVTVPPSGETYNVRGGSIPGLGG
jgi:hypothetical protein